MRSVCCSAKCLVVIGVFVAGVLAGRISPTSATSSGKTELVQVELTRSGDSPTAQYKQLTQAEPAVLPAPVQKNVLPTPREIARQALARTVYLRGGPVYGAGVLIDDAGHVLTCDHVVDGVDDMQAYFHDRGAPIAVEVLERDAKLDLALLRLKQVPEDKTPMQTGSVLDLDMGDVVYAMGAPRKMQFSFSQGIVSYVGRAFDGTLYLQSDLAANSGSSGGPVMNERGELVGLASFILRNSQGLAFAVPIDYAFHRFKQVKSSRNSDRFNTWLKARDLPSFDGPSFENKHAER